ncbi:TLDc domain-containing protein [Entamoeba marina]
MANVLKGIEEKSSKTGRMKYDLSVFEETPVGNYGDVLEKYQDNYEQLYQIILNKDLAIQNLNSSLIQLKIVESCLNSIIPKEIQESDRLKNGINKIVDNMNETLKCVYEDNTNSQEFKDKKKKYNTMKFKKTNSLQKEQQLIINPQLQIHEVLNGINVLKKWCQKNELITIFDSDINGDGSKNVLKNIVMNRKNLYFINIDIYNNVFGGYLTSSIKVTSAYTHDENAFIFSLIRDGKINQKKFMIKKSHAKNAFYLEKNRDHLYTFGGGGKWDFVIFKVGSGRSYCNQHSFEYHGAKKALMERQGALDRPDSFAVRRVLVLQAI